MRISPTHDAEPHYEMAAGEEFALLDVTGEWAWGYRSRDHKVGYLKADSLA